MAHVQDVQQERDLERGTHGVDKANIDNQPHVNSGGLLHPSQTAGSQHYGPYDWQNTGRVPAFGGAFQPGPYKPGGDHRQFANPAPLGLSAFALTTFVLSLINLNARHSAVPNIVVSLAYGYGGLVQLLAGMWEMAVGNTFGATALSSYGGFWISYAIIETGGFGIVSAYEGKGTEVYDVLGFYLTGWFIFTTILTFCTVKSTLAFFMLFFTLDITFLLLAIAHFQLRGEPLAPSVPITRAAGVFGLLAAFLAFWNAWAGIANRDNSFFTIPVAHLPWSEKIKKEKREAASDNSNGTGSKVE